MKKNNIQEIEEKLKKGEKMVAMLAPSFAAEFNYPSIIFKLKKLGFDNVVELTFGAKMINREYHKQLKNTKKLLISSACPGVVLFVKNEFPQYKKSLILVDSPMTAMGKICRRYYPKHKIVFISPCHNKKIEAENSKNVDYVIDYIQLRELFEKHRIKGPLLFSKEKIQFDKFYNDYTKIFPVSGGLSKTAHLKGVIKHEQCKVIDGIKEIQKFLKNPDKNIKFLDALFCVGGCIGGPCTNQKISVEKKRKKVLNYLKKAKEEDIPENRKGLIKKANGINFCENTLISSKN